MTELSLETRLAHVQDRRSNYEAKLERAQAQMERMTVKSLLATDAEYQEALAARKAARRTIHFSRSRQTKKAGCIAKHQALVARQAKLIVEAREAERQAMLECTAADIKLALRLDAAKRAAVTQIEEAHATNTIPPIPTPANVNC